MRDVFETSRVVLTCTVVRGQSSSNKATFKVLRSGTEFKSQEVSLTGDKAYLTIDKLPEVKPDEQSWDLTYKVTCDGIDYDGGEVHKVWPLKVKLKSVDDKAAAKKGVRWVIRQKGEERFAQTRPDGTVVHFLRWPAEFTVDVVGEFRLVKWNKETGRDLEAEVDDRLDPEFESPDQPADKKQYVNLATASAGSDGKGHLVTFKVFGKGPGGAGKGGKEKNKIFIEVTFGMETPPDGATFGSKRNDPERALKGALDIKPAQPRKKTYTGHVELPSDGGTATFQVELGLAGGDTCTVKIGGTPDCAGGPKRDFVNWRRLAYELMYPAFMAVDLEDGTDEGGATVKDYPAALRSSVEGRLATTFIEYKLRSSHEFAVGAVAAATVVTKEFLGEAAGRAQRHILGGAFGRAPHPAAWDAARDDCIQVRLCDGAYSQDTDPAPKVDDHVPDLTTLTTRHPASPGSYYFGKRFRDTADSLIVAGKQWEAKIVPANYRKLQTIEWETPDQPETAGGADAQLTIDEVGQGASHTIAFNKPLIGHTSTSLTGTQATALEAFVRALLRDDLPALRRAGNKVTFKLTSEWGNDRRKRRFDLVKSEIQKHFDAYKQAIPVHPALDDDGNPRTGPTDVAWLAVTTYKEITITLPTGGPPDAPLPGDLVGAASDTKCPITLEFSIDKHYGINGNSGGGSQIMVLRPDAVACAETVCHELGHSMGMTIMAGKSNAPPGTGPALHVDQDGGLYYMEGTPKTSGRRGIHKGAHCASGLQTNAGAAVDPKTETNFTGKKGTCIMWGAGGTGIVRASFCAVCKEFLRARKLTNIRGAWNARADAES